MVDEMVDRDLFEMVVDEMVDCEMEDEK